MVRILLRCIISVCLLFPHLSQANIWGSVGACVNSPCSCGCSNVNETWNGSSESYKHYCNCPPYNKPSGRAGCLKKFDLPGEDSQYYLKFCAEDPGGNTYFNPKARVRMQACNVGACWTESMNLNYDGQCTQWATPYGIPLLRLCARIAVPASSSASGNSDDGYTSQEHLNKEGATVPDKKVQTTAYNSDGTSFISSVFIDRPKLCVYTDPWALDNPVDLMDINPLYQPFHAGSGLSPIAEMMITIVELGLAIEQTLPPMMKEMGIPESVTKMLIEICNYSVGIPAFIPALKAFGHFNLDVNNYLGGDHRVLGCLEIPLGPFPPPYCSIMKPVSTAVTIDPICPTVTPDTGLCSGSSTCTIQPDSTNKCVSPSDSLQTNNAINNMVRIGFDNFIPLCLPDTQGITPSTCINISINPPGFITASQAHGFNDILPVCGSSPCVSTTLPVPSGNSGFRIVYAMQYGATIFPPTSYYNSDPNIHDCPSAQGLSSGEPCQSVWGINAGPFRDVALTFPSTEYTSNNNTLISGPPPSPAFLDLTGLPRSFKAAITRVQNPTDSGAVGLGITDQDPNNICIYENTKSPAVLNGCVPRAKAPMPQVTTGTGDNFNPTLNVTLTVGTNSTTGSVTVPAVPAHYTSVPTELNLAGFSYTSFVTDNYYNVAPFSALAVGTPGAAPSAGFLYGAYMDSNNNLLAATTIPSDTDKYLYGMEYVNSIDPSLNNKYRIANIINGPTPQEAKICLSGVKVDSCPENPRNCVLAYLDSNGKVSTDPAQRIIPNTNKITLTSSEYYNYSIINANSAAVTDSINSQTQLSPDDVSCGYYLSSNDILPIPYSNITQCSAACADANIVEYFVSPDPNQKLTICNTTAAGASTPTYCYTQEVGSSSCQVSKILTLAYQPPVATPPNTPYSSNVRGSAVIANQLLTSGSSVSCPDFLRGVNYSYAGMNACSPDQLTSCANVLEKFSSTTPNTNVEVRQCLDSSYCYNKTVGSTCALGCTGAMQQPIQMSCTSFLSLVTERDYSAIKSCLNPVCPPLSELQITYPTAASCTSTTPTCSLIETVKSGSLVVPVNNCSATYTIKDANDLALASDVTTSFYCYDQPDSNCTLNTTNTTRTTSDNVAIANPITSLPPLVCPVSTTYAPPSGSSSKCDETDSYFNPAICGIRNKTDVERGLCAGVPALPNCLSVNLPGGSDGHALWLESKPGTQVTGSCATNYSKNLDASGTPIDPKRYCLVNPDAANVTAAVGWGELFPNSACVPSPTCAKIPGAPGNNYTTVAGVNELGATSPNDYATISCISGYTAPSPATVQCVRGTGANANTAAWATTPGTCASNCAKVSPTSENNYTTVAGSNADGSTNVGSNATVTCLSGATSTVQCNRGTGANANTGVFASYSNCGTLQCPAITDPGVWTASDSAGNASWAAVTPSGTTITGACKFGYKPISKSTNTTKNVGGRTINVTTWNDVAPTRTCDLQTDVNGNVKGAAWSTIKDSCIAKTCKSINADYSAADGWAKWLESTPTASKDAGGKITIIPNTGNNNSGWVLGACSGTTNRNRACNSSVYSPLYSRYPVADPRRQCIIDNVGNVSWSSLPSTGSDVWSPCCNSCNDPSRFHCDDDKNARKKASPKIPCYNDGALHQCP
jgi:hypothetical protein